MSSSGEQTHSRSYGGQQGNSIFSNLKKLATGGNHGSSEMVSTKKETISSPKRVVTTASLDSSASIAIKPLSKSSSLNMNNLSQYTMNPERHSRSSSTSGMGSPNKYSYSRRSSLVTRSPTNQSVDSSTASIHSLSTTSNLHKFLTNDGTLKLDKPQNSEEIHTMFLDLLMKRNILDSVSRQDQKDLLNYSIEKKWLMVKQDLQSEFKRLKSTKSGQLATNELSNQFKQKNNLSRNNTSNELRIASNDSQSSLLSPSHLPPEFYVRKIISKKITTKELNDLWVSLRTEPLDWVLGFLGSQGQVAIANLLLTSMHHETTDNINAVEDNNFLDRETALFKCLRALLSVRECLAEAMRTTLVTNALSEGLLSTRVATRRLATESLIYLTSNDEDVNARNSGIDMYSMAMESLNHEVSPSQNVHMKARISNSQNKGLSNTAAISQVCKILQQWLYVIENTLDGRGKMGSLVGASDEYRHNTGENSILEYLVDSMVLIQQLCCKHEDVNNRHLMRKTLRGMGFNEIFHKMQLLDYPALNTVLEQFENVALDDYNILLATQKSSSNVDMKDPVSIISSLWDKTKDTEAQTYLLSMLQNLFLSSTKSIDNLQDSSKNVKQFKLMDSLISNVAITTVDSESNFNMAIQRLYDAMQTDDIARRAIIESREMTKRFEEMKAERDYLNEKLSKAENGLVGQLQAELSERDNILHKNKRIIAHLQSELEDLKKKHLLEKHEHEIELRKMLTILNSRPNELEQVSVEGKKKTNPRPLNVEKKAAIQNVLQESLQKTEKDLLLESRRLGTSIGSKSRLQLLKSRMDDIENQARELEMTNFADLKSKKVDPEENKVKNLKEDQINKLSELRSKLASIQNESNEISKFNLEARVNEMFKDKKTAALERLQDLENRYKLFNIDFSGDINIKEIIKDSISDDMPSLDPSILDKKVSEMNLIIDELQSLKTEITKKSPESLSPSSEFSSSDEEIGERPSDFATSSTASSGSSFLANLSQKFATGHHDHSYASSTSTRTPSLLGTYSNRKSFVERLKNTKVNPTSRAMQPEFLTELKSKVQPFSPLEDSDQPSEFAMCTSKESILKENVDSETEDQPQDSNNGVSTAVHSKETGSDIHTGSASVNPVVPPPPLPSFLKSSSKTEKKEEVNSDKGAAIVTLDSTTLGPTHLSPSQSTKMSLSIESSSVVPAVSESSTLPPPPPPPPPPPLFMGKSSSFGNSPVDTSAPPPPPPPPPPFIGTSPSVGSSPIGAAASASSTPPPPPPPPLFMGKSSSFGNSPVDTSAPPPPPPPMLASSLPTPPSASPILPQSPSLFERYPRPKKKLKQIHWEKINDTGGSIWKNAQAEKVADDLFEKGVLSQLEKAFAAREIKSLKSRQKAAEEKISFLSRDVSHQFGINLHMYSNLPVKVVVEKILKCDSEFLSTPSIIEFLSKPAILEVTTNLARNFTPYSTDWDGVTSVDAVKPPEKDPEELQRADQIYLELIVNLQSYWASRMRALTMITTFEKDYSDLVTKIRKIDKAVQSVQDSENLRRVLDIILAVGNYMNDSSKQAQGFKLSTLQRLTLIKDERNSMTFLNYVEKIIRENYPQYELFTEELEPIFDVVKISIEQLVTDCKEFSQSILNVERSIDIGNLSDPSKFHPLDRVLNKVLLVLPEARKKADLLSDEVKLTILEFENSMQQFGEDSKDKFSKNSFFKKFADFVSEYRKAKAQNLKIEQEELAYQRRKKMIEEQQKLQEKKTPNTPNSINSKDSSVYDDDRDAMDKLLTKLKNAGPAKGDPSSARKRALARKQLLGDKNSNDILDNITADSSLEAIVDENKRLNDSPTIKNPSSPSLLKYDRQDPADRARNLLLELRGSNEKDEPGISPKEKLRIKRSLDNSPQKLTFVGESSPNLATISELTKSESNSSCEEFVDTSAYPLCK